MSAIDGEVIYEKDGMRLTLRQALALWASSGEYNRELLAFAQWVIRREADRAAQQAPLLTMERK